MKPVDPDKRLEIERDFHDHWARDVSIPDVAVRESFEAITAPENRAIMKQFGDVRGKKVLDLGCGIGEAAVYFALQGAEVYAADLSPEMLKKASLLAEHHGVTVTTVLSPAEHLPFPDDMFDYVYGSSILHHANLCMTVHEACRVLKPGGQAAFIEPLSYNPLIHCYRWLARDVRTPTETSFRLRDFKFVRKYFQEVSFEYCWFTTLIIFLYMYLVERVHPVQDRYWKRVIREHARYERMFQQLDRFDKGFLKIFPFMKYFCWTVVIGLGRKVCREDDSLPDQRVEMGGS